MIQRAAACDDDRGEERGETVNEPTSFLFLPRFNAVLLLLLLPPSTGGERERERERERDMCPPMALFLAKNVRNGRSSDGRNGRARAPQKAEVDTSVGERSVVAPFASFVLGWLLGTIVKVCSAAVLLLQYYNLRRWHPEFGRDTREQLRSPCNWRK